MSALVLTFKRIPPPLGLAWRGNSAGTTAATASAVQTGTVAAIVGPTGPQGPQGTPGLDGGSGVIYNVPSASSSWVINHSLGRIPAVAVFLSTGELVITDCTATTNSISVVFPSPQSGYVVAS